MNNSQHSTQLNLVSIIEMKAALEEMVKPLQDEIKRLCLLVEGNNQNISIKEFAEKAGLSIPTVRGMMERKQISYNQAGDKKKITIPISELLKIKQL